MSSLVPVQIPCGGISGLTLGNSKTLATKPQGGKLPTPHQTWCITNRLQFSAGNCSRGLDLQPTTLLASHIHGHIYIPSLGASIQRPHSETSLLGTLMEVLFSILTKYFSTLSPLHPMGPWKVEAFVGALIRSKTIPPVLHLINSHQCCSMGENGTLESWRLTLPHCCSKWLKIDCFFWCGLFL